MPSIADMAKHFAEGVRLGKYKSVKIPADDFLPFISYLIIDGFPIAQKYLQNLDPDIRKTIETLLYATAAGAIIGGSIGQMVAGPPGVAVGAAIGAGVGFVAGCIAITIEIHKEGQYYRVQAAKVH